MRLGFDAKRIFNNETGLGHYGRNLVTNLIELAPENDYVLYTPKCLKKYQQNFERPNVKVVRPQDCLASLLPSLWRSYGVRKDIRQDQLDLYHGLSHELPHGLGKPKPKLVVTIHDLIYLRHPELFPWIDRQIYHYKFQYACKHADGVIAISQQTKRDLETYFKVPREKIEVLYQTCHSGFWQTIDKQKTQRMIQKYKLEKPYILYVGSLIERKQALSLVKAFERFRQDCDKQLVLVGQGKTYKRQIEYYVQEKGLKPYVQILDGVSSDELPHLYEQAWVFCYPSLFEGFGIPIIESLCMKTPVLTSKGSCFEEAGGPGALYSQAADVQELYKHLSQLHQDPSLHRRLSEEGHTYIQKFRPEKTAKNLLDYYHKLLNRA